MMRKVLIVVCMLTAWNGLGVPAGREEEAMRAALRARMALMRQQSAMSSDRSILVSGPRSSSNAYLLDATQRQRIALEKMLRMRVPFNGQRIRLQVLPPPDDDQALGQEVFLRSEFILGELTHRIVLPDYESSFTDTAREALVYAFLSVYVLDAGHGFRRPHLPPWFWQGVMHVLYPDDVKITLDYVNRLWRAGQVPSLSQFLQDLQEDRLEEDAARFAGAVVYWLVTRPSEKRLVPQLFAAFAAEERVDIDWLRERLQGDPDELLDRWILAQRHIVRGVGTVLQSHIDDLQELILLYPGRHGIPRRSDIRWGSPLHVLAAYRERSWFRDVLFQRRNQLQMVAQGRPNPFREIAEAFIAVLDGMLSGENVAELEALEQAARMQLQLFAAEVEERGGIWREE